MNRVTLSTTTRDARTTDARGARRRRVAARLASVAAALLAVAGLGLAGPAAPAQAESRVSVTVEGRSDLVGVADPTYLTQLRLTGTGFQSIVNGFGGVYVLFGWVDGSGWQPSAGGTTGADYRYVPDDETNPVGYASFVTFPGSSTSYAANGGELAADGSWSAVLSVPGATFTSIDRTGAASQVNCLEVQCGIITIGAHGVVNANNETFTPISFQDLYSEAAAAPVEQPVAVPEPAATAPIAGVEGAPAVVPDPSSTAGSGDSAATPEPTMTTYVTAPAAAPASSTTDELLPILLWVVVGVAVLAVLAIAFLVWAVVSGRRRAARAAASTPGTPGGAA